MKQAMRDTLFFGLLGLGLFGAAGCREGLGSRCQVSSDCKSGLYCVLPVGGTPASGGTCQTAEGPDLSSDMPVPDLSTNLDLENENDDLSRSNDLEQPPADL
jgi:hypothetical protein